MRVLITLFAALSATAPLGFAGLKAEIIWRTSIGTLEERVNHRGCVCADGTLVVTYSNGAVTVIDAGGSVLALRSPVPELQGALASVCEGDTLYVSTSQSAAVRLFRIGPGGRLTLLRSFPMTGAPNRFALLDGKLWVLGMARVGNSHVPLRRFTAQGEFLDVPEVPLAAMSGGLVNQLVLQGSLTVHPSRQQVIYVPANPFRFFCFSPDGRLAESKAAAGTRHEEADLSGLAPWAVRWSYYDWVRNVVCLPDGRLVAQIIKGARPGGDASFLEIYDRNLDLVARDIPVPFDMGYLFGADAAGYLYFVNLRILGASALKVRLID